MTKASNPRKRVRKGTRQAWVEANAGRYKCGCGCDGLIQLRPEHFPVVPRFLHGHNGRVVQKKPLPPSTLCECGCGVCATPGRRYISGHNSAGRRQTDETRRKLSEAKRGALNPMYGKPARNRKEPAAQNRCACGCDELAGPGKQYVTGHNARLQPRVARKPYAITGLYRKLLRPEHPFADVSGYVRLHRIALEEHLRENDPEHWSLVEIDGRLYIAPDLIVHHIDGNPDNNDIANLAAMTVADHTALHHAQGDIH